MARRRASLISSEKGMVLVFVALGFLPLLAASALAIDLGMLMTARNQAQNSADAGALSSAVGLVFDDFDDRSSGGGAVQGAIAAAVQNQVAGAVVSVTPGDVQFLNDPAGAPTLVKVEVQRSAATGNPLAMGIMTYFGMPTTNVTATATAEAGQANTGRCVMPFTIPDRWFERQAPPWTPDDTFDAFPTSPSVQPDLFLPASSPAYGAIVGFDWQSHRGMQLVIGEGIETQIEPDSYYAWALPGSSGWADYATNIQGCNSTPVYFGDAMTAEGAGAAAITSSAIQTLIDQDPGAYWDTANDRVVSSQSPSPRVIMIPVFDPLIWDQGAEVGSFTDYTVSNFIGAFVEGLSGNDLVLRVTPITGVKDDNIAAAPGGGFPRSIRLVE
jgi:Flp pilus assembly protein TadG